MTKIPDRTPYDGKPYYCRSCGCGWNEWLQCEQPECPLEPEAEAHAQARAAEHQRRIREKFIFTECPVCEYTAIYPDTGPRPIFCAMCQEDNGRNIRTRLRDVRDDDHAEFDARKCDHSHWRFVRHGRYCTCGALMSDPGD